MVTLDMRSSGTLGEIRGYVLRGIRRRVLALRSSCARPQSENWGDKVPTDQRSEYLENLGRGRPLKPRFGDKDCLAGLWMGKACSGMDPTTNIRDMASAMPHHSQTARQLSRSPLTIMQNTLKIKTH